MAAFYQGLKDEVKDKLAKQDQPDEFPNYVAMAVRIDNRLYERRMEKKAGYYPQRKYQANTGKKFQNRRGNTSYGSHPGPIEIDAIQRNNKQTSKCFNCDEPGYFARDCPKPRRLTQGRKPGKLWNNLPRSVSTV